VQWGMSQNHYILSTKNGTVLLDRHLPSLPQNMQAGYHLLAFSQIPTDKVREELLAVGINLIEYVDQKTYVSSISTSVEASQLAGFHIVASATFPDILRKDNRLKEIPLPFWAFSGAKLKLQVLFFSDVNFDSGIEILKKDGYEIVEKDAYSKTCFIELNSIQVNNLLAYPFVRYLDLPPHPGVHDSDDGRNLHRSNMIDRDYYGSYQFDGTGVSVVVNDDGFAGPHIDFEGRANQSTVATDLTGNHGDGTAGIVGSAGNLDPIMRGMATGAYLHVRQYSASLPNTIPLHVDSAVMVFSNSYSDGCNTGYTTTTRKVDQEIYNNPSLIQVFSAGNSNGQNCNYGAGTQWGNITGGHKMSKNCITTANLDANDVIASSSSRGPAHDGRIKPDISAHGQGQMSNDENYTYQSFGGTSAACPGIAGITVQLHQAYRSFNGGTNAPSALLKAAMLNTANDLGNDGPDFIFGWGKINAFKALKLLEENRYLSASISQGNNNTHNVTIPANVRRAKIMIYWADKEASVSATKALVNNLDMNIVNGANTYYPWILNSNPNATTLAQAATRNGILDTLNNVEQIAIDNPTAGTYTINVNAPLVPVGPQNYFIVYEFLYDEITLTFPVGGEGILPNTANRIHWDAYGTTGTFLVEASLDNGNSWSTVQNNVAGTSRFITWNTPGTVTGLAKVRVSRNGVSDESDAVFSIIGRPANLRVTAICTTANSIRLAWDAVPNATAYDVFKLGQKYMDSVGTSNLLTFDVPVPNITGTYWFAVRARGANQCVGLRTIAIRHQGSSAGTGNCVLDCGNDNDAGVDSILSPRTNLQNCGLNQFPVTILLNNISSNPQTGFTVSYQLGNNAPVVQTYTQSLQPGVIDTFTFSQTLSLTAAGIYTLKVWSSLNNDGARCNDSSLITINFTNPTSVFPYAENFQSGVFPPANTFLINPDAATTWASKQCTGVNGLTTTAMFFDNFAYNAAGQLDYFGLTSLNLTSVSAAQISFDVAHAPYSATYNDRLLVEISTNCGISYQTVYNKAGSTLATTANSTTRFVPNNANQWRNEVIDLSPYCGAYVNIRFVNQTAYGNDVFVDNINIVTIASQPLAQFNAVSQNTCLGVVSFQDQSNNIPSTWFWDFGDGNTSTQQNPSHQYANPGQYTVQLIVSNAIGSDTITQSNFVNFYTIPQPQTNTQVYLCPSDSILLTGTGTGTLHWYTNSDSLLGLNQWLARTVPDTFLLRNIELNAAQYVGATSPSIGAGANFTGTAWMNFSTLQPVKIISVLVEAQTAGNRTISVRNGNNGTGTLVLQRTVFVPQGQSRINLDITLLTPGSYSIGGAALNLFRNSAGAQYPYQISNLIQITGSSATISGYYYFFYNWEVELPACQSDAVTVYVQPAQALFNSAVTNLDVTFTDQSTGANSWFWDFGDGSSSTLQNPTHSYNSVGTYNVTLTINGSCSYTMQVVVTTTSISLLKKELQVELLPNPAVTYTRVQFDQALQEPTLLQIYHVDGKKLEEIKLEVGQLYYNIPCEKFAAGTYLIQLDSKSYSNQLKFNVIKN